MSTFNYLDHDAPNGICVTNQPHLKPVFGYKESISTSPVQERSLQNDDDEKNCQYEHGQTFPLAEHRRRHNIRLKKTILPSLFVLLALGGLLVWSCVNWHGWSTGGIDGLVGRASNGESASTWAAQSQYTIF